MPVLSDIVSDSHRNPEPDQVAAAVHVVRADAATARPVILASPHSGRNYRPQLCAATAIPVERLRRSEDAYVDHLIRQAPAAGAGLVMAQFPRVFVDANRAVDELDPGMYRDILPDATHRATRRVGSGLGVIPRVAADGRPLYARPLELAEAERRIANYYQPYHAALAGMIRETRQRFGVAVVLDMHSMPAHSAAGADFVLGDRFGRSCDDRITSAAETALRASGFVTVRNTPYAGGYTTEHYGQPEMGVHALQIEINRGLYLIESRVCLQACIEAFEGKLLQFIKDFSALPWEDCLRT